MELIRKLGTASAVLAALSLSGAFMTGCEEEPFDDANDALEDAGDNIGDAVEEAGENVEDAVD